jgi:hypothetical protein
MISTGLSIDLFPTRHNRRLTWISTMTPVWLWCLSHIAFSKFSEWPKLANIQANPFQEQVFSFTAASSLFSLFHLFEATGTFSPNISAPLLPWLVGRMSKLIVRVGKRKVFCMSTYRMLPLELYISIDFVFLSCTIKFKAMESGPACLSGVVT